MPLTREQAIYVRELMRLADEDRETRDKIAERIGRFGVSHLNDARTVLEEEHGLEPEPEEGP